MKRLTLLMCLLCLMSFDAQAITRRIKTFEHIVNPAETIYSIALRYGVGIETIVEDNEGIDPMNLETGYRLEVRKLKRKEKISDTQITQQWNQLKLEYEQAEAEQNEEIIPGEDTEPDMGDKIAQIAGLVFSDFREVPAGKSLEVAMLLPLKDQRGVQNQFVNFYRGALLAIDELKKEQRHVNLSVYNTERSAQSVEALVSSGRLDNADIILGPIFEEPFKVAADFAARKRIPIVSPLAVIDSVRNPYVFQAPVSQGDKYAYLAKLLVPQNNVVVFSGASDDTELHEGIKAMLPADARIVKYSRSTSVAALEDVLSGDKENVFVVLPTVEVEVDEILARVSSVQNNLLSRSIKSAPITIIGGNKWLRFANIDRTLFFKLNLHCVSSYHADRGSNLVRAFDDKYLKTYGLLPNLYSYRGYDVAKLFVFARGFEGADFVETLNDADVELLQTPYKFERGENRNFINTEWVVVNYGRDFNIRVLNNDNGQGEIDDFKQMAVPELFDALQTHTSEE